MKHFKLEIDIKTSSDDIIKILDNFNNCFKREVLEKVEKDNIICEPKLIILDKGNKNVK